jgi:hypothetical protein
LNRLAAELAAVGGRRDLGEALGARFVGGGFGALDAGEQLLHWKNQEEVDDAGDDEEVNDRRKEAAVRDRCAVDIADQAFEVGLAYSGGEEWSDDVFDEGFGDVGEGGTDDDGDGQVDDVATKDEVAKTFNHCGSPWSEGRLPDSPLSIRRRAHGLRAFGPEIYWDEVIQWV